MHAMYYNNANTDNGHALSLLDSGKVTTKRCANYTYQGEEPRSMGDQIPPN